MAERIVVLDVDKAEDALALVEQCEGCAWFKVVIQETPAGAVCRLASMAVGLIEKELS